MQAAMQDVEDERALSRSRDARDAGHQSEGNFDRDIFQVVLLCAHDRQIRLCRPHPVRERDCHLAAQILAGQGGRIRHDLRRRALRDDESAVDAGSGSQVQQIIGPPHRVGIVLDHNHRIAEIAKPRQRIQQPLIVALMQSDGRLIENIEDAHQPRPDLRGQTNPLALSSG